MFLLARLKIYAAGVAVFITALLGVYLRGRHDEAEAAYEEELNEYIETRKRVDGVHIDDAERWLRKRADKRDL